MTLDAEDKAWIRQLMEELLTAKKPQQASTPGSFLARRQAALDELDRKTGGGRK